MIEIAAASVTFAILMYRILKSPELGENNARITENDTKDLTETDVDEATGTDNATTEDLSQEERDSEIEPVHFKSNKENLASASSERNDMLVLLVYYYQTIVKIIELIMSKRALRKRRSRRDNYESMLPLSRSSKESDLHAPSGMHEENNSDDTDVEQDSDDEFEMQHQEASIENLEVFIAQRRKLETYLSQYGNNEIDISLSEEAENDGSDIVIPPPDTFLTDNERTISDIEKALLIESELIALLIDESPYEESESENVTENSDEKSLDETTSELDNKYTHYKKKSLPFQFKLSDYDEISLKETDQSSNEVSLSFEEKGEENNIFETDTTIKVSTGVVVSEKGEQPVPPEESEISEDDVTMKGLDHNYEEESEISDTLINEALHNSSKHSHISDNDMPEASVIIDEMEKSYMSNQNSKPTLKFKLTEFDENSLQDKNELSTEFKGQFEEIAQESKLYQSNMKEKDILECGLEENKLPTTETYICEDPRTLNELVNSNQADSEFSEPLIEEILNYNSQNLQTLSRECLEKSSHDFISENTSFTDIIIIDEDISKSDDIKDVNEIQEINLTPSDLEFEKLYEESINSAIENTNEDEETFINETFNTEGLSKDIDNVAKTSNKKSFRNKSKRKRCTHDTAKKNKVSQKDNEGEDDEESLINYETTQPDLQIPISEAETREEVQPLTSGTTASLNKGRKYGQVSEYILLKEIEQVESLIREAVAENSDIADSFVESFFSEEINNSESAGSIQNDIRILEPIKEETVEDTNNFSNEKVDNVQVGVLDDKNKDETSIHIPETASDNIGCKIQDVYDFEEAYAVCEYEEVTEDVYETFCDESDFMVPVIKRDDEWWTTLSEKDASQFETVGDKNKAFNNLEGTQKLTENKKKNSVPKKVSFCADNELATIIVDNIDKELLTEHEDISLSNSGEPFDLLDKYNDNDVVNFDKSLFTTEVSDYTMQLYTYDEDIFNNDDIDNVLSSYETLGNLVSVDEYETQTKQTKLLEECLHKLPEECYKQDSQNETYENMFLTHNTSDLRNSIRGKFGSGKGEIVCTDEILLDSDTISNLDECNAFEAEANNSDDYSEYISYDTVERDYFKVVFIDHSNIDECAAFEASEECELIVNSIVDSIDDGGLLNNKVVDSEESEHIPHLQDSLLNERFLVSQNVDQPNHPGIYQTPSMDENIKDLKPENKIYLSETTNIRYESVDKIANSMGIEISYDGSLSNDEDEKESELYISSSGDRMVVLGNDTEMEVENRISNFDESSTQIDKCKAYTATTEPSVIEDAVVSKIKELESQMKAIESCLDSPNNISDPNITTNQTYKDSLSAVPDGKIQNFSNSPIEVFGHGYIPIISHEGNSEYLKNEIADQLSESDLSQSDDNKCKALHTEDTHMFETQPGEIVLDQYAITNFNENIYVNGYRNNDYIEESISISKIDQCKSFKADECDIERSLTGTEVSIYLPIVESNNYESDFESSPTLIIDHTSYELWSSNSSLSNIDQCKAFRTEIKCDVTDSHKCKLLPDEERSVISVGEPDSINQEALTKTSYDISENDFSESRISYSNIDQCTAFRADEIQLWTTQLKEVIDEYSPFSYEQHRENSYDNNELESSNHSYSKIDQCQAFKADISECDNTLSAAMKPSFNTSINLPVLTLSKEESDYTLSVRLEKFKSLEVLQAASISQDESSYKVSFE